MDRFIQVLRLPDNKALVVTPVSTGARQLDVEIMKLFLSILIIGTALLSGCSMSERTWNNQIIVIESEDGKAIKISETITRDPWPIGGHRAQLKLHFYNGNDWKVLDKSNKRTPVYSRLYYADDRFIQLSDPLIYYEKLEGMSIVNRLEISESKNKKFPTGATYKTGYVWDIFISPEYVNLEGYKILVSLIQENLEKIHEAIRRPRTPKGPGREIGRHPTITSIVYRSYDYEPVVGIDHGVNIRFTKEDSTLFISQAPPNQVVLVLPERRGYYGAQKRELFETASIGFITDDQKHILVREPSFNELVASFVGDDWMQFYKSFKNSDGHSIFHYYKPILWHRRNETIDFNQAEHSTE